MRTSAFPAATARLISTAALALFAALGWAGLARPATPWRLEAAAGVATLAGAAVFAAGAWPDRRRRLPVQAVVLLAACAAALLAAGVPGRLLVPAAWGSLGAGLGQGIQALPGIAVPYRGVDGWVRIVLAAGGGALLLGAALLAARAARRGAPPLSAAVALCALFAVPAVEVAPAHPFPTGAVLALLLVAMLWADRMGRVVLAPAAAFLAVAVLAGALAAPRLDGDRPLLDYERIASALTTPPATAFTWTHGYGPLNWPRDGRELLRIRARAGSYWKAASLDDFDGVRWRGGGSTVSGPDTERAAGHPEWRERLIVTVRNLRSTQYVAPGVALAVRHSPRPVIPGDPGTFVTGREPLRRGDSYLAEAYAPHPSAAELGTAGAHYPGFAFGYLGMDLPPAAGGPALRISPDAPVGTGRVQLRFAPWGQQGGALGFLPDGSTRPDGDRLLRRSGYGRMYALARRLRAENATPYAFARAIAVRLADGFAYTERPPALARGRLPLPAFLFDTHAGYCQQFSGTMALLLRMGGVPARVAAGFSTGVRDGRRGEWVVRDLDAHSWVEAYFPGYGWVPFDPTPPAAPARGRLRAAPDPAAPAAPALPRRGTRADAPAPAGGTPATADSGPGALLLGGGILALLAAGAAVLVARRRRVRGPSVAPELAELDRALRRSGRPPAPSLTLRALSARFARHAPAAAGYVAAVRAARFAGAPAGPSPAQRAALRRELGDGLGVGGRLRGWWALPPALPRGRVRVLGGLTRFYNQA